MSVNQLVSSIEDVLSNHGLSLVNEGKVATGEYPFLSQKAIKPVLEGSFALQLLTVQLLHALQTEDEQLKRDTRDRNKVGFMSSDAWHGSRIAEAVSAGALLADEDSARVPRIACKYSKQLSVQLRRLAIMRDAKLAGLAAVFSAA